MVRRRAVPASPAQDDDRLFDRPEDAYEYAFLESLELYERAGMFDATRDEDVLEDVPPPVPVVVKRAQIVAQEDVFLPQAQPVTPPAPAYAPQAVAPPAPHPQASASQASALPAFELPSAPPQAPAAVQASPQAPVSDAPPAPRRRRRPPLPTETAPSDSAPTPHEPVPPRTVAPQTASPRPAAPVYRLEPTSASASHPRRHAGNTLRKKLLRDMSRAAMQFLSIILLCMLGTFAFAALDGMARMTRTTIDTYFEENNLTDFWVTIPAGVDRAATAKLEAIDGVNAVIPRFVMDMDSTLGDDVTINVTAYDGEMTINAPLLREGALLDPLDMRGCLIQERFANMHDLGVGDRVGVKLAGQEYTFVIRGVAVSPEYIALAQGVSADPEGYGFILINARAMPVLPLTQAVVTIDDGADAAAVKAAIEAAMPDALVLDQDSHTSTARCRNDAQMFENMTYIFPILAYAVAALIVMTTLSRMIDNQRMQMGTLKALGFSAGKIRSHYLSYAIVPSLLGAALGTVLGHLTLPPLLWNALMGQSEMPYQLHPPISLPAWGMVLLTVTMSVAICFYTYHAAAKETTAALLRPKPPKDGKRILLERITPLWKRMSFNAKMITRNLLRNKLRTFMSLMGLLACTSLIITSFGLQDSITSIMDNYYTGTLRYDIRATLSGEVDTAESYERRLDAQTVECIMETSVSLRADGGVRTVMTTILDDDQTLQYLGEGETFLPLQTGTLAVSHKLADTLGVAVGDAVRLFLPGDDQPIDLAVGQIVHNNVTHALYMNRTTWENQRKGPFTPTAIQIAGPGASCLQQLDALTEVDSLDYPVQQIDDAVAMLDALSSVFSLLTIIALALAFVICYNMGLMNFVERTREYATLKVLGYHQKEIRRLILHENTIIAIVGVLSGVGPGYLLTDVIMHSCEPETSFYPGMPTTQSVVLACVITFCFSILIQLLLTRKVKKIDMVEALKSVE